MAAVAKSQSSDLIVTNRRAVETPQEAVPWRLAGILASRVTWSGLGFCYPADDCFQRPNHFIIVLGC
jgi:hypothetical protein